MNWIVVPALTLLLGSSALVSAEEAVPVDAQVLPQAEVAPVVPAVAGPDLSMKGRKGLSLVYAGLPAFAWTDWTSEKRAQRYGVGGNFVYNPDTGFGAQDRYTGGLFLFWGLRQVLAPIGTLGHVFTQPGIEMSHGTDWIHTHKSDYYGTPDHEDIFHNLEFLIKWRTGAEIFWPGNRDLSFETGIGAFLRYQGNFRGSYGPGYTLIQRHRWDLGMDILRWDAAINFYYR